MSAAAPLPVAIDQINGLPAHPLLVHAVVVLIPLAAIALVLAVLWPAARRRLGIVTPLLALVALVLVPITTEAGEALEEQLGAEGVPEIERHAHLGEQLLPYVIALFVVALAHWAWTVTRNRRARAGASSPAPAGSGGGVAVAERTAAPARSTVTVVVDVAFAVLGVVAAALAVWMVVRVGDSGAQAVWGS